MKKTKSLLGKTFLFTGILVLATLIVVLSILYLLLPRYYFSQKEKTFKTQATKLTEEITPKTTKEDLLDQLYQFAVLNNADLMAYNSEGNYLPFYSTPYITLQDVEILSQTVGSEELGIIAFSPEGIVSLEEVYSFPTGEALTQEGDPAIQVRIGGQETFSVEGEDTETKVEFQLGERSVPTTVQTVTRAELVGDAGFFSADLLTAVITLDHPAIDKIMAYGTLQPINEASQVIVSLFPILLVVSLAFALPLAYIYSRQLTKPIRSLSQTATAMQDRNPETRAVINSSNEIGVLAQNLNHLYENLIESISLLEEETKQVKKLEQAKTQLMQSASHELKTPLAALNGIVEGMIDQVGVYKDRDTYLKVSKEQIDRLDTLVQEILSASQGDNQALILEDVSVSGVIDQLVADQKPLLEQKHLSISFQREQVILDTDLGLFKRALSNLLTNAIAYSPLGEEVVIQLKEGQLTVKNKAPFVNDDEIKRMTEPFYTRSFSRDRTDHGTGLGLYIASQNLIRLGYSLELAYKEPTFEATISFCP